MFSIREMIDSGFLWLFTVCVLPLCLTAPALYTADSAANPGADEMSPRSISKSVDSPEVLIPPPPPPPPTY